MGARFKTAECRAEVPRHNRYILPTCSTAAREKPVPIHPALARVAESARAGARRPPPNPQPLLSAQIRHTSAARAWQDSPTGQAPAAAYLLALRTWYRSDLRAEVLTGPAAEDFFAAHQSLLRQRAAPLRPGPGRPPLPPAARQALAAAHDSSSAHLHQLVALTQTGRRLPLPAQQSLVKRLAAREQALWRAAQAQENPPRTGP